MKVIYICYNCKYNTNFKGDMNKHLNNLKGCSNFSSEYNSISKEKIEDIKIKSLIPYYSDEYGNIYEKDVADDLKKKNLICQVCQKTFSTKYKLNRHKSKNCHILDDLNIKEKDKKNNDI